MTDRKEYYKQYYQIHKDDKNTQNKIRYHLEKEKRDFKELYKILPNAIDYVLLDQAKLYEIDPEQKLFPNKWKILERDEKFLILTYMLVESLLDTDQKIF